MPRLVYIGQTPAEGTGSPVIVLRHLQRLAARGWTITIIGERGDKTEACDRAGWPVKYLPLRRPWWPPFRAEQPLLRRIRTFLLARECRRVMGGQAPDAIFGYLAAHADFSPEIAAHYARQSGKPLSLLIHDDAAAFARDETEKHRLKARHAWILRQAHRCWFVSPELAAAYELPAERRHVLLPIPEGWNAPSAWRADFEQKPRVYYAGFIWPPQYPLLAKLAAALEQAGARLVLLSRESPELRAFVDSGAADWVKPFPSNREALAHLSQNAAGLLVSYTERTAEMPWVATSFPSKFVEYCHLGLPCAIVAPTDSSIGRWSQAQRYPQFFPSDRLDGFGAWARGLHERTRWEQTAREAHVLAETIFNPENIQREWESALLR